MKKPSDAILEKLENEHDIFDNLEYFVDNVANKYVEDPDEQDRCSEAVMAYEGIASWLDGVTSDTNFHLYDLTTAEDEIDREIYTESAVPAMLLVTPKILLAADMVEPAGGIVGQRVAVHWRRYAAAYEKIWGSCVEFTNRKTGRAERIERPTEKFRLTPQRIFEMQSALYDYINAIRDHAEADFNAVVVSLYNHVGEMRSNAEECAGKNLLQMQYPEAKYLRNLLAASDELKSVREAIEGTTWFTQGFEGVCHSIDFSAGKAAEHLRQTQRIARKTFGNLDWARCPIA
jgi:hypothetical protein